MKQDDKLYGHPDWETLTDSIEDAVERIIDEHGTSDEPWEAVADRVKWPIELSVYRRATKPSVEKIQEHVLDELMEWLDSDFGDPDGNSTKPTEAIKAAARALAERVDADYVSWACELTPEVVRVTREEALAMAAGIV